MPRRKTGIERPFRIEVMVNASEDELISRASFELNTSKSNFLRMNAMAGVEDIQKEIRRLRREQMHIPVKIISPRMVKCHA